MEPQEPVKNDESSGFSKRRISSILKAPRKSARFPDPEQQENVVECAKPVEKRNSRRVSFAPANDVLLFSKDVKNASPARSPLQELMTATAATTQNRVQVAGTEDRIQQIMGMETLLNAPLHGSQQQDKVYFDTGENFGERTLMFSTDDAFMDMTHSHTINIVNDAEMLEDISLQNYHVLPTGGEKTVMFTADDGSMDMTLSHTVNMTNGSASLPSGRNMDLSTEKRNISSTVPSLDPGFENFLASLSKPSGSSSLATVEKTSCLAHVKTQQTDVNKENQVPTSVSAKMEKSLNTSRKTGESSYGSVLHPEPSTNMTEAQTGRTVGFTDENDPFQCLFPTQDMYAHSDKRVSQTVETMKTKKQQSSKTLGHSDPKDMAPLKNTSLHASHPRHQVNFDARDNCREKTIMFTADDECMEMTQSHTVNIAHGPLASQQTSADQLDPGFKNFLASLSKPSGLSVNPVTERMIPATAASSKETVNVNSSLAQLKTPRADVGKDKWPLRTSQSFGEDTVCPENDVSMDMTEAQTGRIVGITGSDDPFQFLCPTQDMYPQSESLKKAEMTSGQKDSEALGSCNRTGMESSLKTSLKTKGQRHQFDTEDDYREKTVRFSADDACMDMTQSHTVNIATDFKLQSRQSLGLLPSCGEKTVRFNANDADMDMTQCLTVNVASNLASGSVLPVKKQENQKSGPPSDRSSSAHGLDQEFNNFFTSLSKPSDPTVDPLIARMPLTAAPSSNIRDSSNEGTVCPEDDVSMDMTEAQTGRILGVTDTRDPLQCLLPTQGGNLKNTEMTTQLQSSVPAPSKCKGMENSLKTSLKTKMQRNQVKFDAEDDCREKTVRFSADDAAMEVTRSHTVNIATHFEPQSLPNLDSFPACGEKTVRFTANDAAMDVTRSHTVNIATHFEPQSLPNLDSLPVCGEKTVRFDANDAGMDMTHCLTVNIASNSVSDSVLPHQESNILSTHGNMDLPLTVKKRERNRSASAHGLYPGSKNSLSKASVPWANPVMTKAVTPAAPCPLEGVSTDGYLDQLQTHRTDVGTESAAPGFDPATDCPEDSVNMDMTEAQTGRILGQTCADELPQCLSSTQDSYPYSDRLKQTEATTQHRNEELGSYKPDDVESKISPDSFGSNNIETSKEPELRNETSSSQKMESSPSAVDQDADTLRSRKSRRKSLADLQSKVRRLSHMINIAPDTVAMESCTTPLPQLEHDLDKNSKDKTISLPVEQPELEMGLVNSQNDTQAQCLTQGEETSTTTTPFNLKTKQLMSRLSMGGFKAKLPQRSKPNEPKKVSSVGEHTGTININVTNNLGKFDNDVSDIYDEELGSYEDMSETLDTRSPQKITEKVSHSQEFHIDEPLEEGVFEEDLISAVNGKKRSLPEDENYMEDEKRMKPSTEEATGDAEMELRSCFVECDGNITTAPNMTAHITDCSSSSHTASIRCEATFESTFKQSLFESQLEDYASDVQKKLEDGTITVLEFFKLFNIDFVIHNPRQSVLPGRLVSDTDRTAMDLLKDRHISRPKQMVYETDVLNLTEKVEGLKVRMRDLDKPLKTVNRPLWEEVKNSSEKELKSFGIKLKERNNFFRKMSKSQSHEMKEVLYSHLVQTNLEEQQKLRGRIGEADEMIKSLDDCICELEAELAAVEEKGFKDKPGLKSRQEEMKKVTEALAENERQMSELELQKTQNSNKINRLKNETRNLESHVSMLQMLNEWKFGEKKDNCTIYTFLHETMHLHVVYEKSKGTDADDQCERKISHITFKLQLDDEKSQCHARLVHKLLSQYIESETSWVEKYPTSRHVAKLLHDIGLVVSRCRLLGEELRLLKMWGGLRLDILDISCVDAQVHIVFSSLKKFSKFEVVFSVSLINQLCVLQVENFKNTIGSTEIQQIEKIVASFSPSKNLLTKIVKKIHDNLLC
ncbi:uncharacterized protein knl1 isoform X2 [Toxotes jaculatrix]|uniref:uncharacterized protein knl1 isoform X2 n=1 Tax=Toxotes jaculatrix TaxID=941984 RepID=UPI001B3A8560|nr:uncharacterized protein knl1 isoform X2 [Toxotes jaculatrix]